MKFLCDRCKTRYSIGDDRVRGKILKIRCKNCANVITVREGMSDDGAAAEGSPRKKNPTTMAPVPVESSATGSNSALSTAFSSAMMKPPPALEEEWYVSIDGEQSGPFSLAEAQKWVGSKPLDADLHCWSEGFDDWLPVDKVSHFRGLRKKPAPANTPPPLPRVGGSTGPSPVRSMNAASTSGPQAALGSAVENEPEPKPLFAATMASLESAKVGNETSRGVPALGNGTGVARNAPLSPSVSNGLKSNGPATQRGVPSGVKPMFDVGDSLGESTTIEPLPFTEEAMTAAEPVAAAAKQQNDAAKTTPHLPAASNLPPIGSPLFGGGPNGSSTNGPSMSMSSPNPSGGMSPSSSNPNLGAALGGPMQSSPMPFGFGGPAQPAPKPVVEDGAVEGDGLDIGEVSRVVKLADLVRGGGKPRQTNPAGAQVARRSNPALGQSGAVGRMSGPAARIAGTGPAPAITNPGVNPEQLIGPDGLPVPLPLGEELPPDALVPTANPAISHKRGMIMLIAGAAALIGILLVVVLVVFNQDDDGPYYVAQYTEIDTTGREIIIKIDKEGKEVAIDKQTGKEVARPVKPPPGGGNVVRPNIPTKPPEDLGLPLGSGDIESMAAKNSTQTANCWRRSRKGAEDIVLSDVKKVTVVLTIDKTGTVSNVGYKGLPPGTKLETCLTNSIKVSWKFRTNPGATLGFTMVPPQ